MNVHNIEQYVGKVAVLYAKSREKKIRKLEQEVALLKQLKTQYEKLIDRCNECGERDPTLSGTCSICYRYTHCNICTPWICSMCNAEICQKCERQCVGKKNNNPDVTVETCEKSICERCGIDNFCIGCEKSNIGSQRACKDHPLTKYEILPGRFLPACALCMFCWKLDPENYSLEEILKEYEEKNNQMKRKFT